MGYSTEYMLDYVTGEHDTKICEHTNAKGSKYCCECGVLLADITIIEYIKNYLRVTLKFDPFIDACKWYSHEDDLREISKKFNKTVLVLHGYGEEHDDIWVKYFFNGKCQIGKAIITFPDYRPFLLS